MPNDSVTCPGCGAKYRTKAQPGSKLKCPKCKTTLAIPQPLDPLPLDPLPLDPLDASLTLAPSDGRLPPASSVPNRSRRPATSSRRQGGISLDPELRGFLKPLGIGIAAVCGLIVLLTIGGLASEAVALAAAIVGVIAMLGLAFAGRIWFIVIGFRHNIGLGIATIFVPLLWSYCLAKQLRHSQHALVLLLSALIPAIVTLGALGILKGKYSPEGKNASRAAQFAENALKLGEVIKKEEQQNAPSGEGITWSCRVENVESPARFVYEGNRALSEFKGYEKDSMAYDPTSRQFSFRMRGSKDMASKYRLYLGFKTNTLVGTLTQL
jgi:hypothetical protein